MPLLVHLIQEDPDALKKMKIPENALFSVAFPFTKLLTCPECLKGFPAKDVDYKFNHEGKFQYCGKCPDNPNGETVIFKPQDFAPPGEVRGLGLIRWPHFSVQVTVSPFAPGEADYYFRPPRSLRGAVIAGDKLLTSTMPYEMIEAIRHGKRVKLARGNVFTFKQLELFAQALLLKIREDPTITPSQRYIQTLHAVNNSWWAHLDPEPEEPQEDPAV